VLSELQRLQRNAWRCVRIIEDLLDFSRRHALTLTPILIDRWVAQQVAEQDNARPIQLELAAGCRISADGERLRQAFCNVLANAVQACEGNADDAVITVSTRCEADSAIICVADNGAGMSRETAARVFEPLFSTKAFGVGLGMPLVKRIVEQHGGSVLIESEQGAGTRVSIVLPRAGAASS
jgi:signal transduction histidine kinase